MVHIPIHTPLAEDDFHRILLDYFPRVYNYLLRFVRQPEIAEDLTQESFLKAWQKRNTFNPKQSLPTWLYSIARHTMIDAFRKKREILDATIEQQESISGHNPESELAEQEKRDLVDKALDTLPEHYATVVYLYYHEEMGLQEIAQVLKKSVRATTSLLHRARAELREAMQALRSELLS
jgi:RNA polymerase sigma-70 factor, ECF subfamily